MNILARERVGLQPLAIRPRSIIFLNPFTKRLLALENFRAATYERLFKWRLIYTTTWTCSIEILKNLPQVATQSSGSIKSYTQSSKAFWCIRSNISYVLMKPVVLSSSSILTKSISNKVSTYQFILCLFKSYRLSNFIKSTNLLTLINVLQLNKLIAYTCVIIISFDKRDYNALPTRTR